MKSTHYFLLLFFGILHCSCTEVVNVCQNNFSSTADTLTIQTVKQKGDGVFEIGANTSIFKKVDSVFPYRILYPKGITKMERSYFTTDFTEKRPFYVDIVKGMKDGKEVFIVDENNNKDLTDDTIHPLEEMEWFSNQNRIQCEYNYFDGSEVKQKTSWLKIGTSFNSLLIGRSDHVTANITIDRKSYKIAAADPMNLSFTYDIHPKLVVISTTNKEEKSAHRDLLSLGEFAAFDDVYYKFHNISKDGSSITLIRENNFPEKIGTQVGMIAPEFTVITTENDTLKSNDLHNQTIVIANSCGCGGDTASTHAFFQMQEFYKNIHILRVDSNIKETNKGFQIDVENDSNKDFYNTYRKKYCSRICYVIGKNRQIIDKFSVTRWKIAMDKLAKEDKIY
ncbi:hypothetical protein EZY14_006335 [Kordia sp. TARA_039_SRF]|nr:hypothetical protein EZY14_006335 [Kordia sp. TARA_039_SRF]